jgi:hypothetical protein
MRTTIELPDGLYREAKTRAVQDGITLKELVVGLIQAGLRGVPAAEASRSAGRRMAPPIAIRKVPGQPPVQPLSNRQLLALLEEEETRAGETPDRPPQDRP